MSLSCTVSEIILDMSQRWLQRNGRRRVRHNEQTDLSRFWVKGHKSKLTFRWHILDWRWHLCLSMRRFVSEICGVECGSREKWSKRWFFAPKIWEEGPKNVLGGSCKLAPLPVLAKFGWDSMAGLSSKKSSKMIKSPVRYNGLAFGGHNYLFTETKEWIWAYHFRQ